MRTLHGLLLALLPLVIIKTNAQDDLHSPCPRLFVYEGRGNEPDRWYGIITLLSDNDFSGVWLRIILDREALQIGNWFGQVTTTDNKEYLVANRHYTLKARVPTAVRFFVKYDPAGPVPRLQQFRLNAKTVCPEGLGQGTTTSAPELQTSGPFRSTTSPPLPNVITPVVPFAPPQPAVEDTNNPPDDNVFGSFSGDDDDFFKNELYNLFNRTHPNVVDDNSRLEDICGTVVNKTRSKRQIFYPNNYDSNIKQFYITLYDILTSWQVPLRDDFMKNLQAQPRPLITYGTPANEGEFPWHVALYYTKGIDLAYICGASLISKNHVLTVAHCVTRTKSRLTLNPDNLVVYLGKYFLKRFTSSGVQDRQVSQIVPHPQYNSHTYSNDIALIKLATPAEFTDYVRPICLWQESIDLNTITHKQGIVVGWGYDENGKLTEHLMRAQMPVVTQESCLFSFPEFYSRFTSSNTYCAGFRNGTSVCNGDSGGGMVFPRQNAKRKTVWHLRGLVSISVALQNQFKCDTSHYVVFTDSAKYLDWVKKVMK